MVPTSPPAFEGAGEVAGVEPVDDAGSTAVLGLLVSGVQHRALDDHVLEVQGLQLLEPSDVCGIELACGPAWGSAV